MEKDIIIDFQQPIDGYGFVKILEDIPKKSRLVKKNMMMHHKHYTLFTDIYHLS